MRAKILVLTVIHFGYAYTADGFAMYDLSTLEEAARAAAEREMQLFIRRVKFGSVKYETAIEIGPPMHQICAFAGERKVNLIITPTHGYTGFRHVLIGSTAEQVVRRPLSSVWLFHRTWSFGSRRCEQTEVPSKRLDIMSFEKD
jgi:nucleotide-binding universal stress UspA family protein